MDSKDLKLVLKCFMEFLIILSISFCTYTIYSFTTLKEEKLNLLDNITNSGKLKAVIVDYNDSMGYPGPPQDYFIDITEFLASRLWSRLHVIHVDSVKEAKRLIMEKQADLFIRTNPMIKGGSLTKSKPYISATWHLIVNRDNLKLNKIEDMKSGTIVVTKNNPFIQYLREIEKEAGFELIIDEKLSLKDIFKKIESGEITATIADNLTSRSLRYYHPKAVIADGIKGRTDLGFEIHPNAFDLKFRINLFMDNIIKEEFISLLRNHYFHKVDVFEYLDIRKFHRRIKNKMPKYLGTIKKYSNQYNLDWRLIAAQIYQESHYNKWARSHASAKGLMQLLPSTADSLGVSNIFSPDQNIKGGVIHLKKLFDIYDKTTSNDRLKIALAVYNMGQGHMYDARSIARNLGLNPDRWYNMLRVLPLLKKKEYYSKAVYGYARGDEPVLYVKNITSYYRVLKTMFPKDPFDEKDNKESLGPETQ